MILPAPLIPAATLEPPMSEPMSERSLNVLFVGPWKREPSNAGVQSSAATLVDGLSIQHSVVVVAPPEPSGTATVETLGRLRVYRQSEQVPTQGGRVTARALAAWLLWLPGRVKEIRAMCRRHRIEIIHLYQLQAAHFPYAVVRALGGPPLVGTFHGRDVKEYLQRPALVRWLVRSVAKRTSRFTAVSRDLGRIAETKIPGVRDVTVLTSGISPVTEAQLNGEDALTRELPESFFLSVGRLYPLRGEPIKGHDLAIRAWGVLRKRYPNLHLVMLGKADERKSYEALAVECGCADRIHILGSHPRASVLRAMHRAHGVITASRSEGGGPTMTVLEAGALAKPLIASDIPSYTECLHDGTDALLVPRGEFAPIVDAVTRVLEEPELARRLGASLTELVTSRYSDRDTASRYAAVYAKAISPP